jgi:hypothetical protein
VLINVFCRYSIVNARTLAPMTPVMTFEKQIEPKNFNLLAKPGSLAFAKWVKDKVSIMAGGHALRLIHDDPLVKQKLHESGLWEISLQDHSYELV